MRDDDVKLKVCHDPLILVFGNSQINRLRSNHGEKFPFISYHLRILITIIIKMP